VGADTSIFAILKKTDDGIHAHNFISNSVDYKSSLNYEKYFQHNDPVLPYAFKAAKESHKLGISKSFTFALDNIIDFQKFSRGHYYNEFLRPNSLRHILATGIPSSSDNSLVYVLGFHRYCNNAFTKKDAEISSYFGPILFNALNNLELTTQLCDHNIIVSYLKKQISETGLVVLDNNNNVVFANHTGQDHLQVKQDSTHYYSGLDRDLITIVESHIPQMNSSSTRKVEFDYNGVKIAARMIIPDIKNLGKRIILNTHRPSHVNISSMEIEKYGLTQRETDISSLIVMGMTSPQISDKLCISIRTVENHLRSIYSKTDVRNRTSLAYKLASPHL
jgi:DNA-binding CsgD family transcriptional regulator